MWLIIIGAIIIICVLFMSGDSGTKTKNTASGVSQQDTTTINGNCFQYLTGDNREQGLSSAKINNNTVYCCASLAGDFRIGSYELNNEGIYDVWNDDHNIKIGYVNASEKQIYLTPGNVWSHYKTIHPYSQAMPKDFLLLAAHWRWGDNQLFDEETRQVVGRFTGDPVAAGAAFICLTYETLMHNKYYDAFHGWK